MEANVAQSNKPTTPTVQDVSLPQLGQQLQYPLDYVTQEILKQFINTAYPIGSVYINTTNSANPSTILGVGAWVAVEGYVIAGYKSGDPDFGTAGATVGAATHTLSVNELPSHTHPANYVGGIGDGSFAWGGSAGNTAVLVSGATGGDDPHNNIQPTLVAYVWQRTA